MAPVDKLCHIQDGKVGGGTWVMQLKPSKTKVPPDFPPSRQHPFITLRPPTLLFFLPYIPTPSKHLTQHQSKWSRLVCAIPVLYIDLRPSQSSVEKDLGVSTFEHLGDLSSLSAWLPLSTASPGYSVTAALAAVLCCSRVPGSRIRARPTF